MPAQFWLPLEQLPNGHSNQGVSPSRTCLDNQSYIGVWTRIWCACRDTQLDQMRAGILRRAPMFFGRSQWFATPGDPTGMRLTPLYLHGVYAQPPTHYFADGLNVAWDPYSMPDAFYTYDGPCVLSASIDLESVCSSTHEMMGPVHSVLFGMPSDYSCGYDSRVRLAGNFANWITQNAAQPADHTASRDPMLHRYTRTVPWAQRTGSDWRKAFAAAVLGTTQVDHMPAGFLHDLIACAAFTAGFRWDQPWQQAIVRALHVLEHVIQILSEGHTAAERAWIDRLVRYQYGVCAEAEFRLIDARAEATPVTINDGCPSAVVQFESFGSPDWFRTVLGTVDACLQRSSLLLASCGATLTVRDARVTTGFLRPRVNGPNPIGSRVPAWDRGTPPDEDSTRTLWELCERYIRHGVMPHELDWSVATDRPVRVVDQEPDSLASGGAVVERTPHVRSRPVELFPDGPANRDTPPPT